MHASHVHGMGGMDDDGQSGEDDNIQWRYQCLLESLHLLVLILVRSTVEWMLDAHPSRFEQQDLSRASANPTITCNLEPARSRLDILSTQSSTLLMAPAPILNILR